MAAELLALHDPYSDHYGQCDIEDLQGCFRVGRMDKCIVQYTVVTQGTEEGPGTVVWERKDYRTICRKCLQKRFTQTILGPRCSRL